MNKQGKITITLMLVLVGLLFASFVMAGKGKPECRDGIDNDGDGLIDFPNDPGCDSKRDRSEYNAPIEICGNGIIEGTEVCDGTSLGGNSCIAEGFDGGALSCASNCESFEEAGCYTDSCFDSDGFSTETVGTVSGFSTGSNYTYNDYCSGNFTVSEFTCNGNTPIETSISCITNTTYSCYLGRCI